MVHRTKIYATPCTNVGGPCESADDLMSVKKKWTGIILAFKIAAKSPCAGPLLFKCGTNWH